MRPASVGAIVFVFAWTLTTHGKFSVSGDEPHYLMIAESLLSDGDLDLANNYAHNDGRLFGHDGLVAGPHVARSRSGALESVHDIGLPVLLVPALGMAQFAAARTPEPLLRRFRMDRGLFAYSMVSLGLIALTAIGASLLAAALSDFSGGSTALLLVGLAISPPILSHSFLVFPETIALFITCVVVSSSLRSRRPSNVSRLFLLALALGAVPWVHRKYVPYVVGLAFFLYWFRRPSFERLTAAQRIRLASAFMLPQALLLAWTWHHWGNVGGPQMLNTAPFSAASFENGVFGLWIDRQSGLLGYAPIYWLVPIAIGLTWRRTWAIVPPVLLLYLPIAAFLEWWAGFAPAARYLVPLMPLLAIPCADALSHRWFRAAAVALFVPQIVIDAFVWRFPRSLWPSATANSALAALGPVGRAYERLLPPVRHAGISPGVAVAVTAVVLLLFGCGLAAEQRVVARQRRT